MTSVSHDRPAGPQQAQTAMILPPEREASRTARTVVRRLCDLARPRMTPGDVDTAVLLTSELVTNAVTHTAETSLLEATLHDRTLRVSVADRSASMPEAPGTPSADAPSGRGLVLLADLAARWGCQAARSGQAGKTVWFELDVA